MNYFQVQDQQHQQHFENILNRNSLGRGPVGENTYNIDMHNGQNTFQLNEASSAAATASFLNPELNSALGVGHKEDSLLSAASATAADDGTFFNFYNNNSTDFEGGASGQDFASFQTTSGQDQTSAAVGNLQVGSGSASPDYWNYLQQQNNAMFTAGNSNVNASSATETIPPVITEQQQDEKDDQKPFSKHVSSVISHFTNSKEGYARLMNEIDDFVHVVSHLSKIQFVSPSIQKFLQYPLDQVTGTL